MDTKTPPIPLKLQEKPQPKKQERVADVSLPPLTPHPNHRQKQRLSGNPWSRDAPYAARYQEHQKKRPYRVLHIGATPLMHACQQADRSRVLRLLTEQEETIGYRDRTLRSALHYCMDAGTGGAVAAAAPELVNAPDAEGHTPLHLAVIAGDTQLVAVLLANGADVNAKDLEGHSVLHWATVCGEAECVRLVLAAGAHPSTPDLRGGSPLHYAAQCCGAAATAELAVPKKVGLKVLQTLLEFGADVNAKDEDGRQPILWAASAGSVEAVLALARAGGSAAAGASDKDGLTALHCAASRGHARCIEALVNLCGSQPDHVDDNGCSALHYAATLGHADATALILKLGADPNRQDRKGRTPALCAAAKGQLETLKILAQHGGSLHARTVRGTGVAHEAVASGRIELIKWLAKKRPSTLDVATQDGKTPLHVAALHGHLDACKVLLDHGARINAVLRTNKGNSMTALDAALYRGHRDCAKLIQMHGGTTSQQLRAHKIAPNKVFATKLRIKHADSSTDSDSSIRERDQERDHPDLYYEERWIQRRTRRKGSLKKLARQDSRSFSEEEVRLSKTSSKKDRQRRTRSESARYEDDDDDSTDRKLRRMKRKKRTTKCRHDYSESSLDSDSRDEAQDDDDELASGRLQRKGGKRSQKGKKEKEEENLNGADNGKDKLANDEEDERSVSDDSLEVVVVKKSFETKCEKLVSGRRSRTPKESSKETKITKTRKSLRRKSKSSKFQAFDDGEARLDRTPSLEKEGESKKEEEEKEEEEEKRRRRRRRRRTFSDEKEPRLIESRYRRDMTDSTSQETVERVVVMAMVHKDEAPDTPKSAAEEGTTKEVTFEDIVKEETVESEETIETTREAASSKIKVDPMLARSEDLRGSLVTKAADLKKDVEDMRHQVQRRGKKDTMAINVETTERKDVADGRLEALDATEPESTSLDSQRDSGQPLLGRQNEAEGTKLEKTSPISSTGKSDDDEELHATESNEKLEEETRKSERISLEKKNEEDESIKEIPLSTLKNDKIVESEEKSDDEVREKSASPSDDKKSERSEERSPSLKKSESHESRSSKDKDFVKDQESFQDDTKSERSDERSPSLKKSESRESGSLKDKDFVEEEKSMDETTKELIRPKKETKADVEAITILSAEETAKELIDDREQVDSARGKSVDLSSESRDSMSMGEDADDRSLRIDTPLDAKKRTSAKDEVVSERQRDADAKRKHVDDVTARAEVTRGPSDQEKVGLSNVRRGLSYIDESCSSSPKSGKQQRHSRPSTGRVKRNGRSSSSKSSITKRNLFESSEERRPDRGAIIAVIESPEWDDEDEEVEKEIRKAIGEDIDQDTEPDENDIGVVRIVPSTSEEEMPGTGIGVSRTSIVEPLPQVQPRSRAHFIKVQSPQDRKHVRLRVKQRYDSGSRDSGIEPSPRVSRIPRRKGMKCCPNTEKHQALNIGTITRDVQISLRRYHLERKIFFQLMELKRLQIRHGRANEQVLVKRQVEAFHKEGMTGPTLGVAKYDQPLTFRHFEAFLYEQLRKLQKCPTTPDFCTEAKQCTQKTHRCHHATTAYTSVPVYTYLGGSAPERTDLLPKIESRGKGQMTVEVTHGEEKQVIALPAEKLDRTKRYFVTFTVKGESQVTEKPKSSCAAQRNTKSV